jgi:hypothetical protein
MLYVHQLMTAPISGRAAVDTFLRDEWLPAVARADGARLAWVAYGLDGSVAPDDVCMLTAVRDAAALERLGDRLQSGDLAAPAGELAGMVRSQRVRMLKPLRYNKFDHAIESIPTEPQAGPTAAYMHDFVAPVPGRNRAYEDLMAERYMNLSDDALSQVVLRASYETAAGGGPQPEHFNLSEIRSSEALVQLLVYEIPKEHKQMGTWMWEGLGVRDRWTTRLVRCATWSPVR